MNELERLKHVNEDVKMKLTTSRLAHTFSNLTDLLDDHVKVARECILTAFSLEPTKERLKRIEELAKRSGFPVLDTGKSSIYDIIYICIDKCVCFVFSLRRRKVPRHSDSILMFCNVLLFAK